VIAWAHPTTGVQPRCAPSLSLLRFLMISGLSDMLKRGFVVTATDYPGLGTDGTHPFLDGSSEARAVLDSVRAATRVPGASASSRFALWGHSQGGQAALFAGAMARSYAPELRLAGVAVAAPATDLATLFRDDMGTDGGNNLTALTLWAWARIYGVSYSSVVQPAAVAPIATIAEKCLDVLVESPGKKGADRLLAAGFFAVPDMTKVEPWRSLIARNSAPLLPRELPVFIAQGDADETVRPAVTYQYARRLCAGGSKVVLDVLPRVGHGWVAVKAAMTAVGWIDDRFRAVPAPTTCADLPSSKLPGSLQGTTRS